ncbi:hypothetical protein [Halobacillus seohaensis]|uniref:Uncharacterized protein n=1 Tax=Halobacillus seohaensis TaxID=447421 RepID=A0ABW2EER2_9BACI
MRLFGIYLGSVRLNISGYYSIRPNNTILIEPVNQEKGMGEMLLSLNMKQDYYLKVKLLTTSMKNSKTLNGPYLLRELHGLIVLDKVESIEEIRKETVVSRTAADS